MKKLLVVSAIAALGLTSVALAGGLPEEMPVAPAAVSSDTGVYLGLEGGWGMTNWKDLDGAANCTAVNRVCNYSRINVSKDNGFVGRAFLGYDMNRYFAIEAGYTYFFNKPTLVENTLAGVLIGDWYKVKSTQAIDLMMKGKLPVVENFDLYAKLGANYLMTRGDEGYTNINNFNVAYGAGADYYITPNIIANVEWLRFNGNDKVDMSDTSKYQPHTDAFMVGLRYKFDL